jgi:hypothetical protein
VPKIDAGGGNDNAPKGTPALCKWKNVTRGPHFLLIRRYLVHHTDIPLFSAFRRYLLKRQMEDSGGGVPWGMTAAFYDVLAAL